uniref:Uncharacterized protein n=1 Tax=Anguilla anguilla TaxID=7936 RepID=A0A0E9RYP4_ANGAN
MTPGITRTPVVQLLLLIRKEKCHRTKSSLHKINSKDWVHKRISIHL